MAFALPSHTSAALLAFGLAAATAGVVTGAVWRWAPRLRLLDVPNARSSHARTTPRGGGLGIIAGLLATLAFFLGRAGTPVTEWWGWAWWVGVLPIALVSLWDDRHPLPALTRLGVHVLGAAMTLFLLGSALPEAVELWWTQVLGLPGGSSWLFPSLVYLVFGFWIVGLTNVYNFLDGIDGIAGLQAVVAGAALGLAGQVGGRPELVLAGWSLAGGAFGFLLWNRPPARIFMGDVGSAFLGFTLAVLPLLAARPVALNALARSAGEGTVGVLPRFWGGPDPAVVLWVGLTLGALWPFLFDGIFTFIRRWRSGENLLASHRSHLYQRLVKAGASHAAVTTLYGAYAAAGAVSAWVAWHRPEPLTWLAAAAVIGLLALRLVLRVWRAESNAVAVADA